MAMDDELSTRFTKLEEKLQDVCIVVTKIQAQQEIMPLILKWVVFPLILILAGVLGIKLLFPA